MLSVRAAARRAFPRATALATSMPAQRRFTAGLSQPSTAAPQPADTRPFAPAAGAGGAGGAGAPDLPARLSQTGRDPLGLAESSVSYVMNPFAGGRVLRGAPLLKSLESIGVTAVETDRFLVTDSDALDAFARQLRAGVVEMPKVWGRRIHSTLGQVLKNPSVDNPAERVTDMLDSLTAQRRQQRLVATGTVGASDAEEELQPAVVKLTKDQQRVVDLAIGGTSLYLGGNAGTGKTVVLREVKRALSLRGLSVGVTAMTGLAAAHLGGCTFHHLFGLRQDGEFGGDAFAMLDVVIVDEVSMMNRVQLEKWDQTLRRDRCAPNLPFGGLQVILCGDFLQLEPIVTGDYIASLVAAESGGGPVTSRKRCTEEAAADGAVDGAADGAAGSETVRSGTPGWALGEARRAREPAFASPLFETLVRCKLVEQVRQADSPEFAAALQELRCGVWPEAMSRLVEHLPPNPPLPPTGTMRLLAQNQEVREANEARLAELPGERLVIEPHLMPVGLEGSWTQSFEIAPSPRFDRRAFAAAVTDRVSRALDASPGAAGTSDNSALKRMREAADGTWRHQVCVHPVPGFTWAVRLRIPPGLIERASEQGAEGAAELVTETHTEALRAALREVVATPAGAGVRVLAKPVDALGLHPAAVEEDLTKRLMEHPLVQPLTVKVGATVMLRANIDNRLVNGSVGTVVGFAEATMDKLGRSVQQRGGMEALVEAYRSAQHFQHGVELPVLPVVRFQGEGSDTVIPPWTFAVGGDALSYWYSAAALCVPLSPAYAFTVHKVQGLTLRGAVRLELENMWPCPHALYVAMSRCRTPDQLSISGFREELVVANDDAVTFDRSVAPAAECVTGDVPVAAWKALRETAPPEIVNMGKRKAGSKKADLRKLAVAAAQELMGASSRKSRA